MTVGAWGHILEAEANWDRMIGLCLDYLCSFFFTHARTMQRDNIALVELTRKREPKQR